MVDITKEDFEAYENYKETPQLISVLKEEIILEIQNNYSFWRQIYEK